MYGEYKTVSIYVKVVNPNDSSNYVMQLTCKKRQISQLPAHKQINFFTSVKLLLYHM